MSFQEHALPGSYYIVFSVWWTVQIYRRYFQSLAKSSPRYVSTLRFPCCCLRGRLRSWDIEGTVVILLAAIGIAAEIVIGTEGSPIGKRNIQHCTMYFFFGMNGVFGLMAQFRVRFLPKGIVYVSLSLAYAVEGLLFMYHTQGRAPLDVTIHQFLTYAIFAGAIAIGLELAYPKNVLFALARTYFTFLQGTWFWQAGFILYAPVVGAKPWDQHDHNGIMMATIIFAWHMAAVLIVMITFGAVIARIYRKDLEAVDHENLRMNLISENSDGQIDEHMDGDSDFECVIPMNNKGS